MIYLSAESQALIILQKLVEDNQRGGMHQEAI
jgi:hypothetical protein